jgi:hypothetical protein
MKDTIVSLLSPKEELRDETPICITGKRNYRTISIWVVIRNENFEPKNAFLINALTNENHAIPNWKK